MLAGLSHEELLHEALVCTRDSFVPFADMRVIRRPGWEQLVTPLFRQGGFNEVSLARLDPAEADAVIAATIAEYDALGIRFRWTVGPDSAPADLGARLAAQGLVCERVVVMAGAIDELLAALPVDPALRVEFVDAEHVEDFVAVSAAGWSCDPAPLRMYQQVLLAQADGRHHGCVAYVEGTPAGVGNHVRFERSAYLIGGVVLPAYRGHGVYRALTAARLRHARAAGVAVVTTQARAATSAPILARLGFTALTECEVYSRRS
jgi:GNAT superfamily N-acetyltransferase